MRNDTHTSSARGRRLGGARGLARTLLAGAILTALVAACGEGLSDTFDDADGAILLEVMTRSSVSTIETRELDGAVVDGTIIVIVREHQRVTGVDFYLYAEPTSNEPDLATTSAPYAFEIDTTTLADGDHTMWALTSVRVGRPTSSSATFTVANGTADGTPGATAPDEPSEPDAPSQPSEPSEPDEPSPAPHPEPSLGDLPLAGGVVGGYVPPPATLYVATNGNDTNTGRTPNDPLRTIQHAANIAQPGDTIYIRAGTYPIQVAFTRSGTPTQPITWTSYPGETAILDGSDQTPVESSHRVWIQHLSHNTFANLEIRNGPREGIIIQNAHHNLFTHLHIHSHHTSGILNMHSNHNTFQYIVTHNNYDRYNPSGRIGDDADGISISSGDSNTLYRIIAYNNSDDGIDTWRSTNTTIDSSIAFNNGRGSHGNGTGIKAGGNNDHVHTIVRNNITFNNRANGFDDNSGQHVTFINNTAYNNHGANFSAGPTATLRNNLSIDGHIGMYDSDHQHNSWNLPITNPGITTTDPTHPHFLTLTTTSPARNAGTTTHNTTSTDLGAIPHGHTITTITNHTLPLHLDIMAATP